MVVAVSDTVKYLRPYEHNHRQSQVGFRRDSVPRRRGRAGLDPKQRIAIRNYISRIALDKIVIIATHVVSDIEFIARYVILLKKGVIIDNAPPHDLVNKIDGKVFSVPVAEDEVIVMQSKFRVKNIARDEQNPQVIMLRTIADEKPTSESIAVAPTLEDYYLYTLGDTSQAT